jgi:hypothetical protein
VREKNDFFSSQHKRKLSISVCPLLLHNLSVVAVVFQSVFHSEMYQNNVFHFLKIIFDISVKVVKITILTRHGKYNTNLDRKNGL